MKTRVAGRFLGALSIVAAATAVGAIADADVAAAALLLLVATMLAALLGLTSGILAALLGFTSLNWFFTPPVHTLAIEKSDDVVAAIAFLAAAAILSTIVHRLSDLRVRAEARAREAQLRIDLTARLTSGADLGGVAASAAHAIAGLFELTTCRVRIDDAESSARGPAERPQDPVLVLGGGDVVVETVGPRRPLTPDDRAVLDGLVSALTGARERYQLERAAADARLAIQVSQTRAGLISAVSHNLRTPLASIRAAAATLRAPDVELDATDRRDLLDTVVEETERLERLVSKTLDLGKIRAGALEPERETIEIGELVAAAIRRLRPLARAHIVRVDVDRSLPPVSVDVAMIEEVFMNLLENALRFGPPGSEITVSARFASGAPAGSIEVSVADHGPGVLPEDRTRIFEDFVRADSRADSGGTGLGLAIARALVTAHGGQLSVGETSGGGATFRFVLPSGTP